MTKPSALTATAPRFDACICEYNVLIGIDCLCRLCNYIKHIFLLLLKNKGVSHAYPLAQDYLVVDMDSSNMLIILF